jgi:hypothetical protein
MSLPGGFTPLEMVLFGALASVVGGMATVVRYFYLYMKSTNKERAEEIRNATRVQTELVKAIDGLPEKLTDKIQIAINQK